LTRRDAEVQNTTKVNQRINLFSIMNDILFIYLFIYLLVYHKTIEQKVLTQTNGITGQRRTDATYTRDTKIKQESCAIAKMTARCALYK